MNKNHLLDVKEADLWFALATINAEQFHGKEISSIQVLNAFNYYYYNTNKNNQDIDTSTFKKLKLSWQHNLDLLPGYEKDPAKLKENSKEINNWIADLKLFIAKVN